MSYSAGIQRGLMAADNFTQIANALFRDRRISFKAKGLFGLISTHREGWRVTVADLVRSGPDGKAAVTTGLKELEQYAYLVRDRERREDGTLGDAVYSITDVPAHLYDLFGEDAPELPVQRQNRRSEPKSENPALENPAQANRTTKNTTSKKTTEQKTKLRPSVRTARTPARSVVTVSVDGGTDGNQVDPHETEQPEAVAPPAAPAVTPTEGVLLLTAIGNEKPELRLTGKVLGDQGLAVDGLLALGWTPEQIRDVVAGRPLPEKIQTTVGAIVSRRLRDAAASPAPLAAPAIPRQAVARESESGAPARADDRSLEEAVSRRVHAECPGDGGMCGRPAKAETGLCRECSGWLRCPECRTDHPAEHPCPTCAAAHAEVEAAFRQAVGDKAYEQALGGAPPIFSEPTESERLIGLGESEGAA